MSRFRAAELGLPAAVPCPFCQTGDTELHSAFGSQLSVATYWCRRCGTAFDWFKCQAASGGNAAVTSEESRALGTRALAQAPDGPDCAGRAQKVVDTP